MLSVPPSFSIQATSMFIIMWILLLSFIDIFLNWTQIINNNSFTELAKGERQESINTMMTQLSNNSSNHSGNLPTGEKSFNTIKTNIIIQYFRSDEKF